MTVIPFENAGAAVAGTREGLRRSANGGRRTLAKLALWRRRSRDRAELAALNDRMLADIGISRAEAEFLANKPFWRE